MTSFQLSVPDDLGARAEARAVEAKLDGAGAYLAALLKRERAESEKRVQLQAAIDEGLASPEVDATIDDIIAEGRQRRAAR